MVNKTKFSTITVVVTTIASLATMGIIGGIGLGQQQIAQAQLVNCTPILVRPLGVLTCIQEDVIADLGPACDIIRLNPRTTPFFANFDLDIIQDLCG